MILIDKDTGKAFNATPATGQDGEVLWRLSEVTITDSGNVPTGEGKDFNSLDKGW